VTLARSIAAGQTIPIRGDVDGNIEHHARLVQAAAEERVRILVFPELSLTGYELDLANDLAFSQSDPRLSPLIELASSYRTTLVVGAPVRLESRLYIAAFVISPDGTVQLYTKHHLGAFTSSASSDGIIPAAEETVFHPGDRHPLVRFEGHTAAVAVCADTGQPSHPKEAAEQGARTYLASMFVIPSDLEREAARLRTYAVRHSMAVVFANYSGTSGGLASAGRSAIWSENGELLAQLGANESGVAVASENELGWRGKTLVLDGL